MFSQRILIAFDHGQSVVYAQASGWDEIYLLWTFRNFRSLPQNVLNPRQQHLIASLYRNATVHSPRQLIDTAVVGRIEDFDPAKLAAFSTSRKDRTPVASPPRKNSADVPVLDRDQPAHSPFALSRMTLKIGAGALVAIIAMLAWHQLGAQTVLRPAATATTSTANGSATIDTQSILSVSAATSPDQATTVVRNLPAVNVESATPAVAAPPAPVMVASAKPLVPTPAPAVSESNNPAKQPAMAPVSIGKAVAANAGVPNVAAENSAAENTRPASSHRLNPATPVVYDASDEQPRMQISGRPRRLVYPECPATSVRGKVSLQAVVEYDGAVSRVTVLTGDRTLAQAAIAAVRQWRYDPFAGATPHVERETNITVSFISNEVVAVSFPETATLSR